MQLSDWNDELRGILPRVTELRRTLHSHPELSGEEKETRALIMKELERLGIEVHTFRDCYGVMGVLRNGNGRCIAIRADMDALPVTEETGLPFASENHGVMHACGHDVHMALALGSAAWFSQNRDKWHGTVKWLFEPAEETFGGAQWMVAQGCMEEPHVDAVIGQHMNPRYPAGTFFCKPGYVSGSSDAVNLTITGKSCHGAYPESGTDAIVIAAQIVSALQTLVSRTLSPFDPAALTIGKIEGGTARNIVCGEVKLEGTLRTLSPETRAQMKERIASVAQQIARGMGGACEVEIQPGYGAVCNDDRVYADVSSCAEELLGAENMVLREAPSLGVESMCYFMERTPGTYYDIGSGIGTALHTPTFLVDEAVLLPGVAMQCASVLALLEDETLKETETTGEKE